MPSNHLILCHPLLLWLSVFPSIRAGSFPVSQLFPSGDQSTGVSASTSVLPMNTKDWFPLGWTGWISLHSKGLSRLFSNTTVQKHQFFSAQLSLWSDSHIHTWLLEKLKLWLDRPLLAEKCLYLLYAVWLIIAFLPRSKHLLISQSAVILEPKTIKSVTVSIVSPSICHEVMGPDAIILAFWMFEF